MNATHKQLAAQQSVAETAEDELRLRDLEERPAYAAQQYLNAALRADAEKQAHPRRAPETTWLEPCLFPLYPTSLAPLIVITLFAGVASLTSAFVWEFAPQVGWVGARLMLPLMITLWLMTGGYATACLVQIIDETAQGNAMIDDWPLLSEWKDWSWSLLFVGTLAAQATVVSLVFTGWTLALEAPWNWIPPTAGAFLLFPFILISALEADAWYAGSVKIWKTLAWRLSDWRRFYLAWIGGLSLLAGIVLAAWSIRSTLGTVALVCPALAYFVLFQARMLGHLAWRLARESST